MTRSKRKRPTVDLVSVVETPPRRPNQSPKKRRLKKKRSRKVRLLEVLALASPVLRRPKNPRHNPKKRKTRVLKVTLSHQSSKTKKPLKRLIQNNSKSNNSYPRISQKVRKVRLSVASLSTVK